MSLREVGTRMAAPRWSLSAANLVRSSYVFLAELVLTVSFGTTVFSRPTCCNLYRTALLVTISQSFFISQFSNLAGGFAAINT
ncbi:hypothetical protein GGR55DRAFT_659821 [Xylaria sp. FL0064]|nr:hypothetical protein GGR55DRAFT_659821 [Xylaria sp. FL0064]